MIRHTNIKLIGEAARDGWMRELAFFHMLKLKFVNSCVYDYKSRMPEIAEKFEISPKTNYNYLNVLRSKGLLRDYADNLMLASLKHISRKKTVINYDDSQNIFDVTCLLYAKLIERHGNKQCYAESIQLTLKGAGRRGDKHKMQLCENPHFRPSLSYRNMAKVLCCSESKAHRIMKNLIRLGVVSVEKQQAEKLAENFTGIGHVKDKLGYRYNIGKKLYEIFGNRIDFLQFPLFLKSISLKQALKYHRLRTPYSIL